MLDRCNIQTDKGLWMRPAYMSGFLDRTITTVVRLGDRSETTHRAFVPVDQDLPVRFLKILGVSEKNIQPVLYPDTGTTVRILRRIVKPIGDLTPEDLAGGSPDIATPELVRWHLANINLIPLPDLDQIVSVYQFEYRPDVVDSESASY